MKDKKNTSYSTYHEKEFLASLGMHSQICEFHEITRQELARRYLIACQKRKEWGSIKFGEILPILDKIIEGDK